MNRFASLLCALLFPAAAALAQRHVVVQDARTGRPVAGVTGRLRGPGPVYTSDAQGRLPVAADTGQVELTHVSYQPLRVQLRGQSPPATVQLEPRTVELANVVVHSANQVLRLAPAGDLHKSGPSDTPNWYARAIWHQPPTTEGTYRLRAVELLLAKRPLCSPDEVVQDQQAFREGRVRVRLLVPAADGTVALADSLTTAFIITPAESRRNHKGTLRLDLTSRHLLLPPAGVVVMVDVLPTAGNETMASSELAPARNRVAVRCHLPGGGSKLRMTSACDYPALATTWNAAPAQCISVMVPERYPAVDKRLSLVPISKRSTPNLAVTVELQQL
ncbi:hypothetical protein [Hymenobacter sp. B81]|uniref:hypothetical protein n=1 Tax=Hymenobacter sp. B81 TaxID=3344878 RepID=UPI0037DD925B